MQRFIPFEHTFIIAEAGVNHNGDLDLALNLVDMAKECGADAVKFQTFLPGECTGKFAIKVDYLKDSMTDDESRHDLTRKLALPFENFVKISEHCKKRGIVFISTPDGKKSLDFLVDVLNVPLVKISSTEVTHLDFLKSVALKKRPIILSTGLSTLGEVEKALFHIQSYSKEKVYLLHCTSEYPAPVDEVNLKAMLTLKNCFNCDVGFSDHSLGKEAAIAAVALGAKVIEKHFTLDKNLPGPDHKASMNPAEFKDFVLSIRKTERLLGDGIKRPTPSECKNMDGIRRSIVAIGPISKGTVLKREMLGFKRPGHGVRPEYIDFIIGMEIKRDLAEDEVLTWDSLK